MSVYRRLLWPYVIPSSTNSLPQRATNMIDGSCTSVVVTRYGAHDVIGFTAVWKRTVPIVICTSS